MALARLSLLLLCLVAGSDAFVGPRRPARRPTRVHVEEWRQYVPLVTSGLVLVDVVSGLVTGKSVANGIMSTLRSASAPADAPEDVGAGAGDVGGAVYNDILRPKDGGGVDRSGKTRQASSIADASVQDAMRVMEETQAMMDREKEKKASLSGQQELLKRDLDRQAERLDDKLRQWKGE